MCNKCDQIDNEIEQLRGLIAPGMDALSLALIRCAIDKAAFKCHGSAHS